MNRSFKIPYWIILAILAILFGWIFSRYAQDDAYITYRYARNIAEGVGFVYNPGERVLGTTTPLYTLLLAGLYWLTRLDIAILSSVLNVICLFLGAGLFFEILLPQNKTMAVCAGLLYITHPIFPQAGGMESPLFLLLLLVSGYLMSHNRSSLAWLCCGFLVITRYEGALFCAVLYLFDCLLKKKLSISFWPAAIPVVPWLVFAYLYFGNVFPNSAMSKLAAVRVPFITGGMVMWMKEIVVNPAVTWILPFLFFGLFVYIKQKGGAFPERILLGWSILYGGFASILAGSFPWYYAALVPGIVLMISKGVYEFWYFMKMVSQKYYYPIYSLLDGAYFVFPTITILFLVLIQLNTWRVDLIKYGDQNFDMRYIPYLEAAKWLNSHAKPGQKLAAGEIGYLGYYTDLVIVDTYGLVTDGLEPWLAAGVVDTTRNALILYDPDYVIVKNKSKTNELLQSDTNYAASDFSNLYYSIYTRKTDQIQ